VSSCTNESALFFPMLFGFFPLHNFSLMETKKRSNHLFLFSFVLFPLGPPYSLGRLHRFVYLYLTPRFGFNQGQLGKMELGKILAVASGLKPLRHRAPLSSLNFPRDILQILSAYQRFSSDGRAAASATARPSPCCLMASDLALSDLFLNSTFRFGSPMCRYKDRSEKNLNDSLVKVTEKLGKFKNVNKKAMDQFNQFTDQVLPLLWKSFAPDSICSFRSVLDGSALYHSDCARHCRKSNSRKE